MHIFCLLELVLYIMNIKKKKEKSICLVVLFQCTCTKGTIYIFVKCERISIEMFQTALLLKKKNLQFLKLCCNKDLFNSFVLVVILLRNNLH